jgi:predicted TPR repeat methyltransferase
VQYPDPTVIAEMTRKVAADKMIARTECDVIDFGCGTGLVGQALIQAGFENITGVDCS